MQRIPRRLARAIERAINIVSLYCDSNCSLRYTVYHTPPDKAKMSSQTLTPVLSDSGPVVYDVLVESRLLRNTCDHSLAAGPLMTFVPEIKYFAQTIISLSVDSILSIIVQRL